MLEDDCILTTDFSEYSYEKSISFLASTTNGTKLILIIGWIWHLI